MSGFRPFTRQLGEQPGVQLNPLLDMTDGVALGQADQVGAAVARLTRGRIDRPIFVTRNNFIRMTGSSEAMRVNGLNQAKLQVYEALSNGAMGFVLQRIVSDEAVKKYAVVNFSGQPSESSETVAFSVATAAPTANFSLWVLHHQCHNDGIKLSLHADQTPLTGSPTANEEITLRLHDAGGELLYSFTGSLESDAKDEYNNSIYLPDVVSKLSGGDVEVGVSTGASIPVTSNAYGRTLSGDDKWAMSDVLACFVEGTTTYSASDYDRCIKALKDTQIEFGYLASVGSEAVSYVGKLAALGIDTNTPTKIDVPGNLTPAQAIAWAESVNVDSHLIHFNWAPLESDDPMNGGRAVWGAGGLQIGFSCSRNARVNAKGFAPKNYPIAGKEWPLNRTNVRQMYNPDEAELSDLAKAKINPVIFQTFNGGGKYAFSDSLTAAKSRVSYRKLQNVAEMSVTIDMWMATQSRDLLQNPMKVFIRKMDAFMSKLLSGAEASEWLVPAQNLPGNAAYQYTIEKSAVSPADTVLITYFCSYDGVARKVILQQVLTN